MSLTIDTKPPIYSLHCPTHQNQPILICFTKGCNSKYTCEICTSECITLNHELKCLSEINPQEDFANALTVDYRKIKLLLESTSNFSLGDIQSQYKELKESLIKRSQTRLSNFTKSIALKFNEYKDKITQEAFKAQLPDSYAKDTDFNISEDIPESFTYEEIRKVFDKFVNEGKTNSPEFISEIQNMIGLVKKYSDNDKVISLFNEMENLAYSSMLIERKGMLEKMFSDKAASFSCMFNTELKEMKFQSVSCKEHSIYNKTDSNFFESNPTLLVKEHIITEKCQKSYTIDSVFASFVTQDSNYLLAWGNQSFTVDVYDLKANQILQNMKGHTQHIFTVRHFFDFRENSDYLLSTSYDKKMIVWKYNNEKIIFELMISINTGHQGLFMYSGLLLFDLTLINQCPVESTFAISAVPNEQLKIFNMKGTYLRSLGNKTDYAYYLNSFFDSKSNSYHIINANSLDIRVYGFKDGELLKVFKDQSVGWHMSAFIAQLEQINYLFESDGNGNLRIWNYETEQLYKKMVSPGCNLRGIVLWNEEFLISASSDKTFKIFSIKEEKLIHSQPSHENVLCTINKFQHPVHGECLFSSAIDGKIKLWTAFS